MEEKIGWKNPDEIVLETGLSLGDAIQLIPALEKAQYVQNFNDEKNRNRLFNRPSEYREQYRNISKALQQARKQVRQLGGGAKLLDQHYLLDGEAALSDQLVRLSHSQKAYDEMETHSGFELMLAQMIDALSVASDTTPQLKSRSKDYTYVMSLSILATEYERMTNRQASANKNSLFYKLVVYYMQNVLSLEIEDPSRHIANMLSHSGWSTKVP